jgi:hypothetical protein
LQLRSHWAYNSDAFNLSPGRVTSKLHDRRVKLDSSQITAIASFLRAINAMENIRQSNRLDNQAKQVASHSTARELARLAVKENQDAIQVLKEGKVLGGYAAVISALESAGNYQKVALHAPSQTLRRMLLNKAIAKKQQAKALIASCDEAATATSALPTGIVVNPASFTYSCSELDAL